MQGLVNSYQTVLASASRDSDGSSNSFKVEGALSLRFFIDITVNVGDDELVAYIDGSPDNSTWWNMEVFDAIATVKSDANSDTLTKVVLHPPRYVRVRYTVGGAITFAVYMDKKNLVK